MEALRLGGSRVREAAAMMAEELQLDGLLDDTPPPPDPVFKLMSDTGDTILLYPGDNVVGRGLGAIRAPTISRKQLCVSIDGATKRAFVRSMRVEGAPSKPGIRKGGSDLGSLTHPPPPPPPPPPQNKGADGAAPTEVVVVQLPGGGGGGAPPGGGWKLLTQKGQSLSLGDALALQLKPPRAHGEEPQRTSEYRVRSSTPLFSLFLLSLCPVVTWF